MGRVGYVSKLNRTTDILSKRILNTKREYYAITALIEVLNRSHPYTTTKGHHHILSFTKQTATIRWCHARSRFQHIASILWTSFLLGASHDCHVLHTRLGKPQVRIIFYPDDFEDGTDSRYRNHYLNSKAGLAEFADEEE